MGKILLGALLSLSLSISVALATPLKVVTSFSILNDLVQQVGGDKVEAVTIVGPESDAHSFEPRPSDAQSLYKPQVMRVKL